MCGIAGFVSNRDDKNKILKKMTDRIAHRGPDNEGFYIDEDVALGHRRLAIIDLSTGNQPMYSDDNRYVIIFNGEIYNYQSLKEELIKEGFEFKSTSDTEVLLKGYIKWGKEVLPKLRGMFAFVIWDKEEKEFFMARDGFGVKQVYYYLNNDCLMFASEIKAFLDHPDFVKEFNESILSAYLCFNSVPTEETFFKGVKRLEPGYSLTYKEGNITLDRFFKLEFSESGEFTNLVDEIHEAVEDSIKYQRVADVEVGSFLSSGVDSSYIVSAMKPDKTYTVGFDDPKYDEIDKAKDLAEELGIHSKSRKVSKDDYFKAFPTIMYYMDEPLADPSAPMIYFLAELASKDLKVVTSGEGADEFFGGYHTYLEDLDHMWYNKIPYFIRHTAANVVGLLPEMRGLNFIYRRGQKLEDNNIGLGRVFSDKEAMSIVKPKGQIHTREITKPFYDEYKDNSNTVKRQVIDFYFWLVRDFLHTVDRNTMIFGLEARVPFLDREVFKVASKMKTEDKINKVTTKPTFRLAAKKVIPNESFNKKKLGFPVPLREWVKEDDVYDQIKVAFNGDIAKQYFEVDKINKLLEDHKLGKKDNYKKVWAVYTFIVWYGIYF